MVGLAGVLVVQAASVEHRDLVTGLGLVGTVAGGEDLLSDTHF